MSTTLTPTEITQLATAIGVDEATVTIWSTDLGTVADGCLSELDPATASKALYYLTAYFINSQGGQVTSESLGDASISYAEKVGGMAADTYGRMALAFAPCLASLQPTKQYSVWLIR